MQRCVFVGSRRIAAMFVFVEGTLGSVELGRNYWIRTTTESGTLARRYPLPRYA